MNFFYDTYSYVSVFVLLKNKVLWFKSCTYNLILEICDSDHNPTVLPPMFHYIASLKQSSTRVVLQQHQNAPLLCGVLWASSATTLQLLLGAFPSPFYTHFGWSRQKARLHRPSFSVLIETKSATLRKNSTTGTSSSAHHHRPSKLQLGLKLQRARLPLETIDIDRERELFVVGCRTRFSLFFFSMAGNLVTIITANGKQLHGELVRTLVEMWNFRFMTFYHGSGVQKLNFQDLEVACCFRGLNI